MIDQIQKYIELNVKKPSWIIRWGISIVFSLMLCVLIGCYFIKIPQSISGNLIYMTDSIQAFSDIKLMELYSLHDKNSSALTESKELCSDNKWNLNTAIAILEISVNNLNNIKEGQHLFVQWEDITNSKQYLTGRINCISPIPAYSQKFIIIINIIDSFTNYKTLTQKHPIEVKIIYSEKPLISYIFEQFKIF